MLRETEELQAALQKWRKHFQIGSMGWSLMHHLTAFGAAIISVIVGFIVQRPDTWTLSGVGKDDLATGLALLAAVLAAIAATGGFERKWRSNRLSRSKVDLLRLDLTDPHSDPEAIRVELKQIIMMHDRAVIGLLRDTEGHEPPSSSESHRDIPQSPVSPIPRTTS